jgi:dinuclear metal center YbgI/SA1388 family protein
MTKIKDVISYLETIAPLSYQESYDNSGLLTGKELDRVTGVIISLDCTEAVVEEAIAKKCNLIVTHHPIIFSGLKKITGKNYVERTVITAVKNDIAIYAIHTNLDNLISGVNFQIAKLLGLKNLSILNAKPNTLNKLVSFVPLKKKDSLLQALYKAGAGNIGNYSECSFSTEGVGSFTPNDNANPVIGLQGTNEQVNETRIEVLVPQHLAGKIIAALKDAHPYEEVAYYISSVQNLNQEIGAGITGEFKNEISQTDFLQLLKRTMQLEVIKFTKGYSGNVKKIAICGGSGSFLLNAAISSNSDAYVSADFKYHEYFDAENHLMICDIGHYESEVATKDLLYDILSKKFSSFALNLSEIDTNPISYFK